MKKLSHIQGDHPILRRIDKYMSEQEQIDELITEMKRLNYENIKIDKKEV